MTRLPILGFAALLALTPAAAADLSIGFIGSLSGANASIARDQLDGFRLAVRQLGNRLGGVEFNFTVSDDRQDQALAQQAASADWEDPHLRVLILSSTSAALDHLVPQAAQHRSVIINLGAASAALAGRDCSPQLFSLSVRPSLLQELTAQYLQSQGYRRVAVLYSDHEAPELDEFRHAFKGEIIEVKSHRGSMNFAPALAQLRAAKPDAAYFLHRNGMAVEFLLQYEAAGLKQQFPLFGSADGLDQTILAASAPSPLELLSIGAWSDDLDNPANKRLSTDFEAEYGRPISARAAIGYDAALLLDAAIRASDRKFTDVESLRAAMKRVEWQSTRGAWHFDNDQFPVLNFYLRQVAADARGRMINEQRGLFRIDVHDGAARECPMRAAEPLAPKNH